MNIFFHELKAYRKSTMIWTLSLIGIVLLFMSLFPSIAKDIDEFQKVMEGFPEAVRQVLGIQLDSIGTVLGFYSYAFFYITLCASIQGMNLGVSIISKEVREKTADFLLTKPVSRTTVLTSKLLAAVVSLVITNIVYLIAANIMISQVTTEDYSMKTFILISLSMFFVQLIFLAIGIIISVVFSKIKSVLTVSLGTVFCFFFLSMLASTSGDEAKRYLSPFKYFDTAYIMEHASYEASFLYAGAGIVVIALIASYIVYTKKDIHTV
ncbi:ABC transporter permease subunit [Bacillus sp. 165]|uniref:ABC transporter permease subunit n=1 Tax=Bacillus sp. 165 TaxID=1529117 RepID=UPI001ADB92CF|nr:ABC transporter permease subunit [Bacillus sp. 165]MBO9129398.1 ABC transporter permease subunit [Bacillus sp. 165]